MKRTLGFALLFTAAYILVFASPLKKEPVLKPVWYQNLTRPTRIASSTTNDTIGFRIGDIFGYAAADGAIKYLDTTQFNVAMAANRFINFSSVSKSLVEKDTSGRITQTIDSRGYPILQNGRLFTIDTNRTGLTELDPQGTTIWSRDFGSLITSMDSSTSRVVVGLLDGSLVVVGKDGRVDYRYTPGGSKVPVIYGCAISADGEYVALVSGLDPQKFILLVRDKTGYRPRKVVDLSTDMRREVLLHFFPSDPYVYVETPGGIDYFGIDRSESGRIALNGRVEGMSAASNTLLFAVSRTSEANGKAELTVIAPPGQVLARSEFDGRQLFLTAKGNAVYLGTGNSLVRIDYVLE